MTGGSPVHLRFQYLEIEDADFTGIIVDVMEGGCLKARFANYQEAELRRECWGNQVETFELPSLKIALRFLESSGTFHRVTDD